MKKSHGSEVLVVEGCNRDSRRRKYFWGHFQAYLGTQNEFCNASFRKGMVPTNWGKLRRIGVSGWLFSLADIVRLRFRHMDCPSFWHFKTSDHCLSTCNYIRLSGNYSPSSFLGFSIAWTYKMGLNWAACSFLLIRCMLFFYGFI